MTQSPKKRIMDLLHEMESMSAEERLIIMDDWMSEMRQAVEDFDDIYNSFEKLKQENIELQKRNAALEDAIQALYKKLDEMKKTISTNDFVHHRGLCEDLYKAFWNELDEKSQEFFVTAHYIFDNIQSKRGDFSPVVMEFCRIFENELDSKIFHDYVSLLSRKPEAVLDMSGLYEHLKKAVNDNIRYGDFFLSSTDMVKYLGMLRNNTQQNFGYEYELRAFLERKGSDIAALSAVQFESDSLAYVEKYRNEAAHPNLMGENDAKKCKEKTKKIVKKFIQYNHSA